METILSTLILALNPETVALCHTLSHFSALFCHLPLTVDTVAHGGEIYLTLFYTIDHALYCIYYRVRLRTSAIPL